MANKTATLKVSLTYTGPSNETIQLPTGVTQCAYQSQISGAIDIPATTVAGDFTIPFDSIAKPTLVVIENLTGQECKVKINGTATYSHSLPVGATMIPLVSATATGGTGTPITALVVATLDVQAADGTIGYRIFGDPS